MKAAGKTCLITGGTSGIGAATARQLASLGATVIIVGRNAARCIRLIRTIQRAHSHACVDFLVADLSSQKDIHLLAENFAHRYSHLDILVNNAGAIFSKPTVSVDGLEMTFALNHMGYFLLTSLLLESLKASKSARVVVVSSAAHVQGFINFHDLQMEHYYDRLQAYAQSKLANLLFTYELSRRLEGTRVTANALHPGAVATNFGTNNNWIKSKVRNLVVPGMINADEGAETIIYLATSADVNGMTGGYFFQCKPICSSDASHESGVAEKLWSLSEQLGGITWSQSKGIAVVSSRRSFVERKSNIRAEDFVYHE